MTYSIIGRDQRTGEIGIAVQSRFFAAGRIVPWIEAGVGAVAVQAFGRAAYGYDGLAMMRAGVNPAEALARITADDAEADLRQVALLDRAGRIAVHTGARTFRAHGHEIGRDCVAEANCMTRATVWPAMVRAFEGGRGDLADRLLAAMVAAEREGGDIRGAQAASLIVVAAKSSGHPELDRVVDLRIDDHADPVGEIGRLLAYSRAQQLAVAGTEKAARGDAAAGLADLDAAVAAFPDELDFVTRHAGALMSLGRVEEARRILLHAVEIGPNWGEFIARVAEVGMLPVDPDLIRQALPQPQRAASG